VPNSSSNSAKVTYEYNVMNTIHPETHFYKNMVRVMPSVEWQQYVVYGCITENRSLL